LRDYELVVVLSPEVGDEGFPTTVERISSVIQGNGGEIKNVDAWGRRRLAYPIRHHLDGYYAVTQFAAEPQAIRPLEANLDLAEDVLRHLVIKVEEIKPDRKAERKLQKKKVQEE
jgi:small subunit ribosomal protein S6